MASAKILLFTHKTLSNGSHPIVLQIIKDRTRKIVSLGKSVYLKQWDSENNRPGKNHPNHIKLASYLKQKLYQAEKIIIDLDEEGAPYTIDDIIYKIKGDSSSRTVFKYSEELAENLEKSGRIGNAIVYRNTISMFKKSRNGIDLSFNQLSYRIIKDFEEYLLKNGRKVNTISVHLRTLRAIYNYAIKDKVAKESLYPFKSIKIKSETTAKRAISKDDISQIRTLPLEIGGELDKARDFFLFCFNLRGMSFVDMAFLKVKHITNDRILYTRKKTGQKFSIKITEEAKHIIEKYCDRREPDNFIFPVIERKGNEYLDYKNALRLTNKKLKLIGEMANCSIPISTYVSRHSWATIAKRSGISTAIISEGLGHNSEKTTQIYLDSFEDKILDDANDEITK